MMSQFLKSRLASIPYTINDLSFGSYANNFIGIKLSANTAPVPIQFWQ